MNGFVVDEPLAALSDEELLPHITILPANLGSGDGGGRGFSAATPESLTAFGKEVLEVGDLGLALEREDGRFVRFAFSFHT